MATGLTGSYSPVPGNRPMERLKRDVLAYVGLPDDPGALTEAETAIDSAVNQLNTRPWRWAVTYDDLVTVLNQFDYDVPRDLAEPFNLERLNQDLNPNGRLSYKDPKTFVYEHDRAVQPGTPTVYTILERGDGRLTLDKAPDQAFVTDYPQLRLWYLRNAYRGERSLNVPPYVEHFVLWYARWELAMTNARDRVESAERAWGRIWQEIVRKDNAEVDFV